jgi:hypothetical protein
MRAKPDLVPDCDVHGAPMCRVECSGAAFGLGPRDMCIWRCTERDCDRYFYGSIGYRSSEGRCDPTSAPHCRLEGAYLVVQQRLGVYICPVAGCTTVEHWRPRALWRQDVGSESPGSFEEFDSDAVGSGQTVGTLSH